MFEFAEKMKKYATVERVAIESAAFFVQVVGFGVYIVKIWQGRGVL